MNLQSMTSHFCAICRSLPAPFDEQAGRRQESKMQSNHQNGAGRWRQRSGRALSGLAVLFLLFDSTGKLLQIQPVVEGTLQLGYPRDIVFPLGVILFTCVL